MPTQLQIAPGGGIGGTIQGAWGTYSQRSDGTYIMDSRDATTFVAQGFQFVAPTQLSYTLPLPPGAAAIGNIVASGALSNGTVAVTANPDTMRPVNIEVGTGTGAITGGTVAVTYQGNDGQIDTDTLSLVCGASSSTTQGLSRGVVTISSITVAGLVGGTAPWIRASTTAALSVPVDPGAIDFVVTREYHSGATAAVGTLASAIGSITPGAAPNGTITYSFVYDYVAPNV